MKFSRIRFALAAILGLSLLAAAPQPAKAATEVPALFTVTGSGWGHGIGLSQYGARGMALDGYLADGILQNYFPGTTYADFNATADAATNNGLIRASLDNDATYILFKGEDNPKDATAHNDKLTLIVDGNTSSPIYVDLETQIGVSQTGTSLLLSGGPFNQTVATTLKISWVNTTTLLAISDGDPRALSLGTCEVDSEGKCPNRFKYGYVDIFVSAAGRDSVQDLHAVNTLRVNDEYLYGLGEMPSSWPAEALKAQVVAARSYAIYKIQNNLSLTDFDDCACHIYTSPTHQVFSGFNKEASSYGAAWVAAVDATRTGDVGKVITYNNAIVSTYYSSSTGGRTQASNEVWAGSFIPYLAGSEDRWSLDPRVGNPNASWSSTLDQATLVARFRAQGVGVSDISSFAISGKYPSGGVSQLTITDSVGATLVVNVGPGQLVTPTELKNIFNAKATYFSAINPGGGAVPGTATPPPAATKISKITNVRWPSSKIVPGSTFVTGKVSPIQSGVQVQLQVLQRSKWVTVATDTTGPQGIWKTTWNGINAGSYKMRIVAITPKNSLKTSTRSLKAVGSVSIGGPKSVARGGTISVGGSVKAAVEGIPVLVQMKVGGGAWKSVATVTTDGAGNWGFSTAASAKKNTTQFRVKTTDGRVGKLTSKTIRVAVK